MSDMTLNDAQFRMILNEAYTFRREVLKSVLDRQHEIDRDCGYPTTLNWAEYSAMYEREGIARRVVELAPLESWKMPPWIYEDEDPKKVTPFEAAFEDLKKKHRLFHYLKEADIVSGIGRYGILFFGIDDGKPFSEPVEGVDETGEKKTGGRVNSLLYIRAFSEGMVKIKTVETDAANPRFGSPVLYEVTFSDEVTLGGKDRTLDVHWTRVIHLAECKRGSEVYGTPRMKPVYNRLFDCRKILSGSGEMFWQNAAPGYALELLPDFAGGLPDKESLTNTMHDYTTGLRRWMSLDGATVKSLTPQAVPPNQHFEAQIRAIAITLGVPYRILQGSEEAKLAGSQDSSAWNSRLEGRRNDYLTPEIIKPAIDRLIAFGALPEAEYKIDWPSFETRTDKDVAEVAKIKTEALEKYVSGGVSALIPPANYLTGFLGLEQDEADAILQGAMEQEPDPAHDHAPPPAPETPPQDGPMVDEGDQIDDSNANA